MLSGGYTARVTARLAPILVQVSSGPTLRADGPTLSHRRHRRASATRGGTASHTFPHLLPPLPFPQFHALRRLHARVTARLAPILVQVSSGPTLRADGPTLSTATAPFLAAADRAMSLARRLAGRRARVRRLLPSQDIACERARLACCASCANATPAYVSHDPPLQAPHPPLQEPHKRRQCRSRSRCGVTMRRSPYSENASPHISGWKPPRWLWN